VLLLPAVPAVEVRRDDVEVRCDLVRRDVEVLRDVVELLCEVDFRTGDRRRLQELGAVEAVAFEAVAVEAAVTVAAAPLSVAPSHKSLQRWEQKQFNSSFGSTRPRSLEQTW
jgi:hypothetical protein